MKRDIETKTDIELLINTFYDKVLKDELIGPFFKHIDFNKHLPKMIHFWSFVLLDEAGYTTDVTKVHQHMKLKVEEYLVVHHKLILLQQLTIQHLVVQLQHQ